MQCIRCRSFGDDGEIDSLYLLPSVLDYVEWFAFISHLVCFV